MISSPDPNIGRQLHEVIRRRQILPVSYREMVAHADFLREIGHAFNYVKATPISPLPQKNLHDQIDAKVNIGINTRADTNLIIQHSCMPEKILMGHGWLVDG
jgi:hypothetical protein